MVWDCKAGAGTHSSLRCTQTFCLKNYFGMYISHVCVCARVCVWARAIVNMWCQGFYFHYEGSGNWTQVIILGSYGAMPMSPNNMCMCFIFDSFTHEKYLVWSVLPPYPLLPLLFLLAPLSPASPSHSQVLSIPTFPPSLPPFFPLPPLLEWFLSHGCRSCIVRSRSFQFLDTTGIFNLRK